MSTDRGSLRDAARAGAAGSDEANVRLHERAAAEGLIDVAYAEMDSPVGTLLLAVTPRGLASVQFEDGDLDRLLARFTSQLSPRVLRSPATTDGARRELDEYFEGHRQRFDLRLDRRLMGSFAEEVLRATARVPFGQLATYGEIAGRIGHPGSARAVGAALGSNPIAIVVPCHRIVGAGGKLTGYAGGLHRKEFLLGLEGSLLT